MPGLAGVAAHRLAWLGELPARGDLRVLEVGCATGKIALALAAARGWQVAGIEPAPAAAERARAAGLETHTGTLDDYAGPAGFDAVLFVHVLEHLPDPLAALARARELLAPGGRLVVALPNAEAFERRLFAGAWDGWDLPRHVHHFGPASLCALLARAGFAPGRVRHEWYSLLGRSLRNRRLLRDPEAELRRACSSRRGGSRWPPAATHRRCRWWRPARDAGQRRSLSPSCLSRFHAWASRLRGTSTALAAVAMPTRASVEAGPSSPLHAASRAVLATA